MINKKFAVIGISYGDEGKGLVVDYLCREHDLNPTLVIRYSGGQQAGHTVVVDETRHVFSNFGSGTLRGVPTYWSKSCTVDPIGIYNEFDVLAHLGIEPTLLIDGKCPVTTPYDKYQDHVLHTEFDGYKSCGVGYGTTLHREEEGYSLLFEDLFHPKILKMKYNAIRNFYFYHDKEDLIRVEKESEAEEFFTICDLLINSWAKNVYKVGQANNLIDDYENLIYESSQGLLLDQNIGFHPYVTRSSVGCRNLGNNLEVYYVTRAYQTRHGDGPMTNENIPHNISLDKNETNVDHPYQGKFRRTLLDLDLLRYALDKDVTYNNKNNLVITCLDHVRDEWRYTYENKLIYCANEKEFISSIYKILNDKMIFSKLYISKSPDSKDLREYKI